MGKGWIDDEGRIVLLNTPHLDWLTITSYDHKLEHWGWRVGAAEEGAVSQPVPQRRGYNGVSLGGVDILQGSQLGKAHYLVNVTGRRCWAVEGEYTPPAQDVKCTRLDACLTIREPWGYDAQKLYEVLSDNLRYPWRGAGAAPAITLVKSRTGATIYIGSPKSEKRARLYQKEVNGENLLRLEAQYRGDTAHAAYTKWQVEGDVVAGAIVASLLARWPQEADETGNLFRDMLDGTGEFEMQKHQSDDARRIEWLKTCVLPAFREALKGKYRGEAARLWLELISADTEPYSHPSGQPMSDREWEAFGLAAMQRITELRSAEIEREIKGYNLVSDRRQRAVSLAARELWAEALDYAEKLKL